MNRWLLVVGITAMDVCWAYPWSVLAGASSDAAPGQPLLSAPTVFGLIFASALMTRVLGRRARATPAVRYGVGLSAIIACGVALRLNHIDFVLDWGPALALGLALLLWWRGVQHAEFRQRWSRWIPSGIGSTSSSYITRWV